MHTQNWKTTAAFLGVSAGALTVAALSAPPAYAWTDNDPAGVSQCSNPSINNAGTVTGDCLVNNAKQGYVRELSGTPTFLAPLASTSGGAPCGTTDVNNAAQGSETIIGWCTDANSVSQGVFWKGATPAAAPTLLQPLILDDQTIAAAVSAGGVIVGVSINNIATETPVVWSSAGVATGLSPALLQSNANCTPADISDAATPSIIGNCDDSGTGGGEKAVLWANQTSAYSVLPVPSGGNYCTASEINLSGQILGECTYADDSHRAVVWGAGGTGPSVLTTVGGAAVPRTYAVDINDSGVVACDYLSGGGSAGFKEPCEWNPAGGNTNALAITVPAGATGPASTTGIGNNGKIVGAYETAGGVGHPFRVESGSTTVIDEGTPEGGPTTITTAISTSGGYAVGTSEDTTEHNHDVGEVVN
jgi:hypothetical protein